MSEPLVENKILEVAQRIKTVREDMGFTLEQVAEATSHTVEECRSIENGETDFGFTFIYKFSQLCKIEITDIMEGNSPILTNYTVTKRGEGMPIRRLEGYTYFHLAAMFRNKLAEPFYVTIPYSEDALIKPQHLVTHKGQEFDVVIKGCVRIQIGDHHEILHEGDSIYYDSSSPHDLVAMGGESAEIYAVVMNPDGKGTARYEKQVSSTSNITNFDRANIREPIYERFITEIKEGNVLKSIKFHDIDSFNFAFDVVDAVAEKSPNKIAMVYVDNNKNEKSFTFGDMSRESARTANYFKSLGIKKGDKVMLVLRRNYQFWFSILALHRIGAVVIPATDQLTEHDFEYRFNAVGVKAIVCSGDGNTCDQIKAAIKNCPTVEHCILTNRKVDGWHSFDDEYKQFSDVFEKPAGENYAGGNDNMLMFFTSGTTGSPKPTMHNFKYPLGHFTTAKYWHNVDPNGIHFTVADTGWGKALWGKLYGQWLCESATFVYDFNRFDANDVLSMLEKYRITSFCAPPTIYRFFIKEDLKKYDLSSIKHATVAGEALNSEVFIQFIKATGIPLMEGFGQTETTLTVGNFVGADIKPGSMGKPSPQYHVDIVLPDGTPTKIGEVGEIVIHTDESIPCGLFCGYYNDEKHTKEAWHDGLYHTGDTAWRDQDGFFWYVGRVDDLIKSSGYRIGPFEVESVLMEIPYILECAVTAAPDPIRGQVVKASIVLVKGKEPTDDLKKEIQNYVKSHTAPYKYPRIIEFMDELPKTISGKIRRTELREN